MHQFSHVLSFRDNIERDWRQRALKKKKDGPLWCRERHILGIIQSHGNPWKTQIWLWGKTDLLLHHLRLQTKEWNDPICVSSHLNYWPSLCKFFRRRERNDATLKYDCTQQSDSQVNGSWTHLYLKTSNNSGRFFLRQLPLSRFTFVASHKNDCVPYLILWALQQICGR